MNLNIVINQLRTYCPSFNSRVAGAGKFEKIEETVNLALPFALVIPLDDSPGERMSLNDVRQPMIESFAVIVAVNNTADEQGQSAVNTAHDSIRAEVWKALLGWQPDGLMEKSRYRGIEYQGGNLLKIDRSRLWYQFDFGAYMEIEPEDGWQGIELGNLPHFDGANINVDDIDPAADPNLSYPGPDGRIEHTFKSPKSGNLP